MTCDGGVGGLLRLARFGSGSTLAIVLFVGASGGGVSVSCLIHRRQRCFAMTLDGHYWWWVHLSSFSGAASFTYVSLDAGEKSVKSAEE